MVQENTGFEIDVTRAELMEGPDPEIIRLIREEIDPCLLYTSYPFTAMITRSEGPSLSSGVTMGKR